MTWKRQTVNCMVNCAKHVLCVMLERIIDWWFTPALRYIPVHLGLLKGKVSCRFSIIYHLIYHSVPVVGARWLSRYCCIVPICAIVTVNIPCLTLSKRGHNCCERTQWHQVLWIHRARTLHPLTKGHLPVTGNNYLLSKFLYSKKF